MTTELVAALLVGLAGAGHCLGMCGGIAAALGMGARKPTIMLAYHLGRLLSYGALGVLAGWLASTVDTAGWTLVLRYIAGILLIAMGLYIADWWRGLAALERLGGHLWQPVQRLARHWLPPRGVHHGLILGLCWGMMPCGLIYSALALSATQQSPLGGGLMMLSFGLGTLPAMIASSIGGASLQSLLRKRGLKLLIALLLIASGAWGLYTTYSHSSHLRRASAGEPMQHSQHQGAEQNAPASTTSEPGSMDHSQHQ